MPKILFFTCAFFFLFHVKAQGPKGDSPRPVSSKTIQYPKRELRGVWIATVANIDWPSRKGLSSDAQRVEFTKMTDRLQKVGINALFVQVRAASDAFYARSKEPWSEWLMGKQGLPPSPFYDPMEFMIDEAHDKGMEFHAWLNLNRGEHRTSKSIVPDHLTKTKPQWFLDYDGIKLFNFGLPEVRTYIIDVVMNIVREYDIDGIHFDDYFYPYKVAGQKLNDYATYKKYPNGMRNIEDWRRNNIDMIIKSLHDEIEAEKPWVKFGVSPFGVWRNKQDDPAGSNTRGGQPSYDDLYADTRKWCRLGWIDYVVPQIYFPFEHKLVPYGTLTDWWAKEHGRAQLYIGHGAYRVDAHSSMRAWQDPGQIGRQIDYNRRSEDVYGSVFFSANAFLKNNLDISESVHKRFKYPALPPAMPWKNAQPLDKPTGLVIRKGAQQTVNVDWDRTNADAYVLYRFEKGEPMNMNDASKILTITRTIDYVDSTRVKGKSYVYALTALDRLKNESEPVFLDR
ncbi:family 10 glycosylhydrolase [Marinilongibacter aquaticus]|uniref:glycoside hydrolase family 10 protein n=1 Tax=Marinilongibacter aquaticus TaxID=2975157 RepID=UPI0021BD55A0|nr:family 10 glycosylhydrolase [Marinilongibacter aquaticus]UBM60236.1 family 10 glycosylhydrolase [Marinilongibacter aquaticus]